MKTNSENNLCKNILGKIIWITEKYKESGSKYGKDSDCTITTGQFPWTRDNLSTYPSKKVDRDTIDTNSVNLSITTELDPFLKWNM